MSRISILLFLIAWFLVETTGTATPGPSLIESKPADHSLAGSTPKNPNTPLKTRTAITPPSIWISVRL